MQPWSAELYMNGSLVAHVLAWCRKRMIYETRIRNLLDRIRSPIEYAVEPCLVPRFRTTDPLPSSVWSLAGLNQKNRKIKTETWSDSVVLFIRLYARHPSPRTHRLLERGKTVSFSAGCNAKTNAVVKRAINVSLLPGHSTSEFVWREPRFWSP